MCSVTVKPGICGFNTSVTVVRNNNDRELVDIFLISDCESVQKFGTLVKQIQWRQALQIMNRSIVYNIASRTSLHPACPIPVALLKAIEVEVGVALKGDVSISFNHDTRAKK